MQDIKINGSASLFPLFSTPVGCYTDMDYLNIKSDLLKMCYDEMENDNKGVVVSNRGGWQSKPEWFLSEKNKLFYEYIHKMLEKIFYESFDHSGELSFSISNCWININPPGSYNVSHTHPGCDYAGVFYLKLPDDTSLVFESPDNHSFGRTFSMYSDEFKNTYGVHPEIEVFPSEGTVIVFPSGLRHFVDENTSDEDRVSIAFNIAIENYGRFGECKKRGRITC